MQFFFNRLILNCWYGVSEILVLFCNFNQSHILEKQIKLYFCKSINVEKNSTACTEWKNNFYFSFFSYLENFYELTVYNIINVITAINLRYYKHKAIFITNKKAVK